MKTHNQETHDANADFLTKMQKPLGHHSWWYTNRGPDDCIDVKMHCWVDTDEVYNLLTEKEKKAVSVLNIDLDEVIDREKWNIIEFEAEYLKQNIIDNVATTGQHTIDSLDFGGRSGGWLAVVFDLDVSPDYLEGYDYMQELLKDKFISKGELSQACKDVDNAIKYINDVHEYVKKVHKSLCDWLENPEAYIDYVKDYIALSIESEAETIKAKADNLAKLAE